MPETKATFRCKGGNSTRVAYEKRQTPCSVREWILEVSHCYSDVCPSLAIGEREGHLELRKGTYTTTQHLSSWTRPGSQCQDISRIVDLPMPCQNPSKLLFDGDCPGQQASPSNASYRMEATPVNLSRLDASDI